MLGSSLKSVSSQRLSDVTRQDLSALVDRWTGLAQQSLVDSVDALVASNGAPLDVLKLLRRALAIAPNDRELDARYRRLKSALSRQVQPMCVVSHLSRSFAMRFGACGLES